jgi:hypothetical protein
LSQEVDMHPRPAVYMRRVFVGIERNYHCTNISVNW